MKNTPPPKKAGTVSGRKVSYQPMLVKILKIGISAVSYTHLTLPTTPYV